MASEVDHVVPVIQGGTDAMDNLRSLCQRCHTRRHGYGPAIS
jgi:5-methylcytosine-specific restriction endonuclease McrA